MTQGGAEGSGNEVGAGGAEGAKEGIAEYRRQPKGWGAAAARPGGLAEVAAAAYTMGELQVGALQMGACVWVSAQVCRKGRAATWRTCRGRTPA